jgi:hypothetical protein
MINLIGFGLVLGPSVEIVRLVVHLTHYRKFLIWLCFTHLFEASLLSFQPDFSGEIPDHWNNPVNAQARLPR